jgi:hypothetical protein
METKQQHCGGSVNMRKRCSAILSVYHSVRMIQMRMQMLASFTTSPEGKFHHLIVKL